MNKNTKNRIIRTITLSILALAIGGGVGLYQAKFQNARVSQQGISSEKPLPVAGLQIGGPFTLTNHDGEKVTEKTYDGQYKLIYFGFTYCPAICPTELQKVSRVMTALEKDNPELANKIQPLFITIDPTRDTVDVMREYVSLFHPKIIGLTGTQPQTDFITKSYRIFARRVDDPDQQDYTMDHSSYLYLMGPDNDLKSIYRMDDTPDELYDDILKHLNAE